MPMTEYEQALVFAAKNGNEKCFEELYREYYQKVYSLAKATVKNKDDAEDILQQTFILAWKNIGTLEDNSAFNTWIQRITLNQCYSFFRKNKPEISIDDENEEHGVLELESDLMLPEIYAQKEDLRVRLGGIVAGLSEVQRQTIQLFYFDDMSVEEIAEVMDCSVGTVKSRLFLARKAIRIEVEENERKFGEKFYCMAGLPMLAFGKIFFAQTKAESVSAESAALIYEKITAEVLHIGRTALSNTAEAAPSRLAGKAVAAGVKKAEKTTALSIWKKALISLLAVGVVGAGAASAATIANRVEEKEEPSKEIITPESEEKAMEVFPKEATEIPEEDPEKKNEELAQEEEEKEAAAKDAYEAYATLLSTREADIDAYTWQKGHYGKGKYTDEDEPKPVVLADVYGDELPELIYVAGDGSVEYSISTTLHIVTYEDGELKEIYRDDCWDHCAGGGFYYALYQKEGSKNLYTTTNYGDDYWIYEYAKFGEENGKLVKNQNIKLDQHPDYEHIVNGFLPSIDKYYCNESEINEAQFVSYKSEMTSTISAVLMYSVRAGDEAMSFIAENGCPAMTCRGAIRYLLELAGMKPEEAAQEGGQEQKAAGWKEAYLYFLLSGDYEGFDPYMTYERKEWRSVSLYDLDFNGIPELLICNGVNGRDQRANYVFTFADGEIKYCGNVGFDVYTVDGAYSGLFRTLWLSGYYMLDEYAQDYAEDNYIAYYTLENGQIHRWDVCHDLVDINGNHTVDIVTDDMGLYEAAVDTGSQTALPSMGMAEVNSSWESFVAAFGG